MRNCSNHRKTKDSVNPVLEGNEVQQVHSSQEFIGSEKQVFGERCQIGTVQRCEAECAASHFPQTLLLHCAGVE